MEKFEKEYMCINIYIYVQIQVLSTIFFVRLEIALSTFIHPHSISKIIWFIGIPRTF